MGHFIQKKDQVVSLIRTPMHNQIAFIQDQYHDIDEAILKYDLNVVDNYELTGVKKTDIAFTPQFKKLVQLIITGEISGVVVSRIDRFFWRPNFRTSNILQEFLDANPKIYTPEQVVDVKNLNDIYKPVVQIDARYEMRDYIYA